MGRVAVRAGRDPKKGRVQRVGLKKKEKRHEKNVSYCKPRQKAAGGRRVKERPLPGVAGAGVAGTAGPGLVEPGLVEPIGPAGYTKKIKIKDMSR